LQGFSSKCRFTFYILPYFFTDASIDGVAQPCYYHSMDLTLYAKLTVRLYSDSQQRCFGPGIATLLSRVREHHSLRAAAASMEMAYSKAWRIIRTAESAFGCKLLLTTTGGARGGGAVLSPEAEKLLEAYEAYCAEVNAFSEARFEEHFGFCRDLHQT